MDSAVTGIFKSCLFKEDEAHDNNVMVEGENYNVAFHPGRLKENSEVLKAIINECSLGEMYLTQKEQEQLYFMSQALREVDG